MINSSENIFKSRWGILITILICVGMFWLGFLWVTQNNQPDNTLRDRKAPLTEQRSASSQTGTGRTAPMPLPQKIPKEYNPGDSLLDLKIERDREKSRDIETMKELLDQVGLTDKARQEAEQELWRLTAAVTKEHEMENILKAKGLRDCMVTIGQQAATVVVGGKLKAEEARGIGELLAESSTLRLDQIRIMERW